MDKSGLRYISWKGAECPHFGPLVDKLPRTTMWIPECPKCHKVVVITTDIALSGDGKVVLSDKYLADGASKDRFGYIHVVFGETGEFEDRRTWPVIAYGSWADATRHAVLAELGALEACRLAAAALGEELRPGQCWSELALELKPGQNPYDMKMRVDYNGVTYSVVAVPFRV